MSYYFFIYYIYIINFISSNKCYFSVDYTDVIVIDFYKCIQILSQFGCKGLKQNVLTKPRVILLIN